MFGKLDRFMDALSANTDDDQASIACKLAHMLCEFLTAVVAKSQDLADHSDHHSMSPGFKGPIDFLVKGWNIDRFAFSKWCVQNRQDTSKGVCHVTNLLRCCRYKKHVEATLVRRDVF